MLQSPSILKFNDQFACRSPTFSSFNLNSVPSQSSPNPALKALQNLPERLPRPEYASVSESAIGSVCPDLVGVPEEYILACLKDEAEAMREGLNFIKKSTNIPSDLRQEHLPSTFQTPLPPTNVQAPTHILAISSSTTHSRTIKIFPIHALLMVMKCTGHNLPPFAGRPQIASEDSEDGDGGLLQLPVVSIWLPHPECFDLLHAWLYDPRPRTVLNQLLIGLPNEFIANLSDADVRDLLEDDRTQLLSSRLHSALSKAALHRSKSNGVPSLDNLALGISWYAARVQQFAENVLALGIVDRNLWNIIDLAWVTILGARDITAGPPVTFQ